MRIAASPIMSGSSSNSRLGATAIPPPLQLESLNISSTHAHRKQSSVSSISSNGSKTAAFFATSPEQTLPLTLSRQGSTSSTSGIHSRYAQMDNLSPISPTTLDRKTSLDRGASINSTSSSRRWLEFEGRPVTPLPSPYGAESRAEQLDYAFPGPQRQSSTDSITSSMYASPPQSSSSGAPRRSEGSRSVAGNSSGFLSASSSATAMYAGTASIDATATSPKTADFFSSNGAGGSGSYNARSAALSSSNALQRNVSLQERRKPPPLFGLDTPTRFPSLVSQPPSPGFAHFSTAAESPREDINALRLPVQDEAEEERHYVVLGSQPIRPLAIVSPPSPDMQDERRGFRHPAATGLASSPVKATRHVHGPSENATGSSILPPIHVIQTEQRRKRDDGTTSEDSLMTAVEPDTPSKEPRLLPPEESEDEASGRIGAYKVERVLGVGAFSKVVLARRIPRRQTTATPLDPMGINSNGSALGTTNNTSARGVMALKMLEREPCKHNERMRVSWVREVEVLKHVVHPNIVRFMSSFSTRKHHVLVLESVTGGELFDYLAKDQPEIAQREWLVRRIFGELANAVGWMHSINLVHRDIKLENILLTQEPRSLRPLTPSRLPAGPLVKISDFGLSRFLDLKAPLLETRCGSEEYAAPELVMGKRYEGRKTDVWALGVVLYALLTGTLPFLPPDDNKGPTSGLPEAEQTTQSAHVTRETQSSALGDREGYAPQGRLPDARARKAHLLRIAKGDLRWPQHINDDCRDQVALPACAPLHRLATPPARMLVAKLLRRDAEKRIAAWDVWNEQWMCHGSIKNEQSAAGEIFTTPIDPRSVQGQDWLTANARVHSGASDVVLDD